MSSFMSTNTFWFDHNMSEKYACIIITTCGNLVTERMGQCGLYLLTMCEVAPEGVSTTMAEAFTLYEAITAEMAAVVVVSVTFVAS